MLKEVGEQFSYFWVERPLPQQFGSIFHNYEYSCLLCIVVLIVCTHYIAYLILVISIYCYVIYKCISINLQIKHNYVLAQFGSTFIKIHKIGNMTNVGKTMVKNDN